MAEGKDASKREGTIGTTLFPALSPDGISDDPRHALLDRLELFFCKPEFTSAVGDYTRSKLGEFQFTESLDDEQPLHNFAVYQGYTALVEEQLGDFLRQEGTTSAELMESIKAFEEADNGASTCIDFLLASTTYNAFCELMADMYNIVHARVDEDTGESTGGGQSCWAAEQAAAAAEMEEFESEDFVDDDDEEEGGGGGGGVAAPAAGAAGVAAAAALAGAAPDGSGDRCGSDLGGVRGEMVDSKVGEAKDARK